MFSVRFHKERRIEDSHSKKKKKERKEKTNPDTIRRSNLVGKLVLEKE
jgi:hypothetical protein